MSKPSRIVGATLLLASVAALAVAIPTMTRQIRAENAGQDLPFYGMRSPAPMALPFVDGKATFAWGMGDGTAPVTMTLDEAASKLNVEYRGETHAVPMTGAIDPRLPGFARFRDSQLQLVVISEERPARSAEGLESEPVSPDRLVLAARIERDLRPDEDPSEMAGLVDRKAWRYEILEFVPVGDDAQGPKIRIHEIPYAELPELERTWQYAAALNVTPPLKFPKLKDPMKSNRGLNGVTWPFPVAGLAILAGALGVIVLSGSFVRRKPAAEARKSADPARPAA
jgi:hypothetical protein